MDEWQRHRNADIEGLEQVHSILGKEAALVQRRQMIMSFCVDTTKLLGQ